VADGNGLPIAVGIASGQLAECRLVRSVLSARFLEEVPQRRIGDKAYDSNQLDAERLAEYGIEMIAPHNPTHRKTQVDPFYATADAGRSNDSSRG
jgi:hypothetical protein